MWVSVYDSAVTHVYAVSQPASCWSSRRKDPTVFSHAFLLFFFSSRKVPSVEKVSHLFSSGEDMETGLATTTVGGGGRGGGWNLSVWRHLSSAFALTLGFLEGFVKNGLFFNTTDCLQRAEGKSASRVGTSFTGFS